jgi:hypothetical protein
VLALRLVGLASACAFAVLAVGSVRAAPDAASACPAPKPLPAAVKRPPKGASATQLANFLLALPQRKPCDVSMFTSRYDSGTVGLYPEGSAMVPASGPVLTEDQARAQLGAFMRGSPKRGEALRLYGAEQVKAKIAEPSLRAAFAAVVGTPGGSTLSSLVKLPTVTTIRYGGVSNPTAVAQASGSSVLVNRRYASEHFGLLIGVIPHEILHHDNAVPGVEEAILNGLTAIVYLQTLARHPELATSGTELSREKNDEALRLLNSRSPGSSRAALVVPNGRGIAPGSARTASDVFTFYLRSEVGRPGGNADPSATAPAPPILAAILRAFLAPGVKLPKPLTYSKKTAELFSKMNDTWLSPVDRLRVSVLLGLVSMEEITAYTGLSRAKAIATFRLAPILAVK